MNYFARLNKDRKTSRIGLIITAVCYVAIAVAIFTRGRGLSVAFSRLVLETVAFFFVFAFFYLGHELFWKELFEKRLIIAIVLFVILVAGKYNYSSVGVWNAYIQPGEGNQYAEPVFGEARAIRSDEWLVSLPRHMSSEYVQYSEKNSIVRATETENITASGLQRDIAMLCRPADCGYILFGSEIGEAFMWNFKIIFGFLVVFELLYILSKKNKAIALVGAIIIMFSGYSMWWSIVDWMWTGAGALVCFNYMLETDSKKVRFLSGIGMALFFANFVIILYPAWQVPAGYVFLSLLIWVIIQRWKDIKSLKLKDWLVILICVIFCFGIIGRYMYVYRDYITAVMNTAYPGHRVVYGGYALDKLNGGLFSLLLPFKNFANPSEFSRIVTFFPLGIILSAVAVIKNKGKNCLLIYLMAVPVLFITLYCTVPLPEMVCKLTLMTYSMPKRAVDVLGFANVILGCAAVASLKEKKVGYISAAIISAFVVGIDLFTSLKVENITLLKLTCIVGLAVLAFAFVMMAIIGKYKHKFINVFACLFVAVVFVSGAYVNPVNCGLSAITSKPLYSTIREIVESDSDAKWIAVGGIVNGNYLIASGARAYNSVNYVPNYELWERLGFTKEQEEIYNRYAHIEVVLSDTTYAELVQTDYVRLYATVDDLMKLDTKYVLSVSNITDTRAEEIYSENGMYIYKLKYA